MSLILLRDPQKLLKKVKFEVFRCAFCGFCEYACPTIRYGNFRRQYGPRGRIQLISMALMKNIISKASLEGIYTCLECGACSSHCPAKINIAEVVRAFRALVSHGIIKIVGKEAEIAPIIGMEGEK